MCENISVNIATLCFLNRTERLLTALLKSFSCLWPHSFFKSPSQTKTLWASTKSCSNTSAQFSDWVLVRSFVLHRVMGILRQNLQRYFAESPEGLWFEQWVENPDWGCLQDGVSFHGLPLKADSRCGSQEYSSSNPIAYTYQNICVS